MEINIQNFLIHILKISPKKAFSISTIKPTNYMSYNHLSYVTAKLYTVFIYKYVVRRLALQTKQGLSWSAFLV